MRRLALLTLLLASSALVAAPAPLPKPQRKTERAAAGQTGARALLADLDFDGAVAVWGGVIFPNPAPPPPQKPAQPPNADPPG